MRPEPTTTGGVCVRVLWRVLRCRLVRPNQVREGQRATPPDKTEKRRTRMKTASLHALGRFHTPTFRPSDLPTYLQPIEPAACHVLSPCAVALAFN